MVLEAQTSWFYVDLYTVVIGTPSFNPTFQQLQAAEMEPSGRMMGSSTSPWWLAFFLDHDGWRLGQKDTTKMGELATKINKNNKQLQLRYVTQLENVLNQTIEVGKTRSRWMMIKWLAPSCHSFFFFFSVWWIPVTANGWCTDSFPMLSRGQNGKTIPIQNQQRLLDWFHALDSIRKCFECTGYKP